MRLTKARIPWAIRYDEIILVLKGSLKINTEDRVLIADAMDSIWLPANTKLTYEADDALLFYAIHPANWASES